MFTGIIEEMGRISSISNGSSSASIWINADAVLDGTNIGDSIAVNGVCLTVTQMRQGAFCADVMPKTLQATALGKLSSGDPVNLERALRLSDRLGGHIVSGHIDGTGHISSISLEGNAHIVKIEAAEEIMRYVIRKGSIAIDGISLTVADVLDGAFTVSIIPHTFASTSLLKRSTGDIVNLECDVIGKYAERAAIEYFKDDDASSASGGITLQSLIENGF